MIDSILHTWIALPPYGRAVVVFLLLGLVYAVVKKLVKIAFMITILLALVFMIRLLLDRVNSTM